MTKAVDVTVIGAGPAGLMAARELKREGLQVTVFEKSDKLGGQWVYDSRVDSDSLSQDPSREVIHTSVYQSLRTNPHRALMSFSDFNFEDREYGDPRGFPGHKEVLAFLNDFSTRFGVTELTQFNSEVVRVEPVDGRVDKWVVEWKGKHNKEGGVKLEEKVFDAVVVCNGHFTEPRIAQVPGIEKWPGKQIHSHNYRIPKPYKDQVVVIIGGGPSALDISMDISKVAKEVHLSSRFEENKFLALDHYHNIWQHSEIYLAKEDGSIEFEDASFALANVVLHCTGYKFHYPFLNTNGIVTVDDNRVGPLYKHVFPPKLAPRLSFIGLLAKGIIFQVVELQSKWIARVLSGKVCLPSEEDMMADVNNYYKQLDLLKTHKRHTHQLQDHEKLKYMNWIAVQASASPVEDWMWHVLSDIVHGLCVDKQFRDDYDIEAGRRRTFTAVSQDDCQ